MKDMIKKALDALFLCLAGIYTLCLASMTTTFYLPYVGEVSGGMLPYMAAVALIRLLFIGPFQIQVWISLLLGLTEYFIYCFTGFDSFLGLAFITIGFAGIDYRKALKMYLYTIGPFLVITFLSALEGSIDNLVYFRNGIRSAWGVCYPTDAASSLLFLTLVIWAAGKSDHDWMAVCMALISLIMSRIVFRSNTSFLCGLLLLALMAFHIVEKRAGKRMWKWFAVFVDFLLVASFFVCGLLMISLLYAYHHGLSWGVTLNGVLSDRLRYAMEAWKLYGLKAFGTPFTQVGAGFSTFSAAGYNFVDSSYPLILLRYGWVPFLVIGVFWSLAIWRAIRCGQRKIAYVMALVAVHSFAEHHFMEVNYNIFLTMICASFGCLQEERATGRLRDEGLPKAGSLKRILPAVLCAVLCAVIAFFSAPAIISWMKTIFQAEGLTGRGGDGYTILLANAFLLIVALLCIWAIYSILRLVFRSNQSVRSALAVAALSICLACLGLLVGNHVLAASTEVPAVDGEEQKAIELALSAAKGRVYVDDLPVIYRREMPGISYSPLAGEDYARLCGDTMLMKKDQEYNIFFQRGFLYTSISEDHALYSSDQSVIDALTDAGYHFTGYYPETLSVDLAELSAMNGLPYSERVGLMISGPERSVVSGPFLNMYGGKYTVQYVLELSKVESYQDEVLLCELSVSAFSGEKAIFVRPVYVGEFSEDRTLEISIPFTINSSRGVEFLVTASENKNLYVKSICVRRTPDLDVHSYYDADNLKIRDEYFYLDGTPFMMDGGYHSCDYGYDRNKNINHVVYYDLDNHPVLIQGGYSEVRRVYNDRRQIIQESYFGLDGQPAVLGSCYSMVKREYDAAGNMIVQRYCDADGGAVLTVGGYSSVYRAYNGEKQVVREEYRDVNDSPVMGKDGYFAVEQEYDGMGNVIIRRFYGLDRQPVLCEKGYAEVHMTYNDRRQVVREQYYDTEGEKALLGEGYFAKEYIYEDGVNTGVLYYDRDGRPVSL